MKNLDQSLETFFESADLMTLKVKAYDTLRLIEACQMQLRLINEHILKKENEQANTLNAKQSPASEVKEDNSKEKK